MVCAFSVNPKTAGQFPGNHRSCGAGRKRAYSAISFPGGCVDPAHFLLSDLIGQWRPSAIARRRSVLAGAMQPDSGAERDFFPELFCY